MNALPLSAQQVSFPSDFRMYHSEEEIDRMVNEGCPHDLPYPVNPTRLRGRMLVFDANSHEPTEIHYNKVRTNEE